MTDESIDVQIENQINKTDLMFFTKNKNQTQLNG